MTTNKRLVKSTLKSVTKLDTVEAWDYPCVSALVKYLRETLLNNKKKV